MRKRSRKYNKRGIFTVTQLSCTFRPPKRRKTSPHKPPLHQPALQALALRDQKIYVHGAPQLPVCSTRIYLDLEGDPDRQFVYLLGMIIQAGAVQERYTFWADTPDEEARLYQQFLEIVARYPDSKLYTYGSYEATFLRRMGQGAACPTLEGQLLARVVNVLSLIYAHVYFPTYSNGLKDIGQYLGYRWSAAEDLRAAKYCVAEAVGGHGRSGVQGHAHHLQHGGLSRPPDRDRVPLYRVLPPARRE